LYHKKFGKKTNFKTRVEHPTSSCDRGSTIPESHWTPLHWKETIFSNSFFEKSMSQQTDTIVAPGPPRMGLAPVPGFSVHQFFVVSIHEDIHSAPPHIRRTALHPTHA
jgi:hypothetical protein